MFGCFLVGWLLDAVAWMGCFDYVCCVCDLVFVSCYLVMEAFWCFSGFDLWFGLL